MTYEEYKSTKSQFNKLHNKLHSLSCKLNEEKNEEIRKIYEKYNKSQKELSNKINNLGYNDLSDKIGKHEEIIRERIKKYLNLKYNHSRPYYSYIVGTKYITVTYGNGIKIPKEHILDEKQYSLVIQELKVEKL